MTIRIIMLIAEVVNEYHWIRIGLIAVMRIYALDNQYHSPLELFS